MEYEAEITIKVRVVAASINDAVAQVENVELPGVYVEDTFELIGIKKSSD